MSDDLAKQAEIARSRSYSPYSRYAVGAAIRLENGKVFSGCNVENATYGASTCAEQTAILKAVSELGPPIRIKEVLVITDSTPPGPPCGICLQVISEFSDDPEIHLTNPAGDRHTFKLRQLLGNPFVPKHLVNRSSSPNKP